VSPKSNIGIQPQITASMAALTAMRHAPRRLEIFIEGCMRLKWLLASLRLLLDDSSAAGPFDRLDQTLNIMQSNIAAQIHLDDLAEFCRLSTSHYVRLFKARNGQTPINYFLHLKIQRACDLLETTRSDIREVALLLGYTDPYYFSRIFKRFMGVSPHHYRQQVNDQ
jgi:transcriptional regulator GlxA family with amidase domain